MQSFLLAHRQTHEGGINLIRIWFKSDFIDFTWALNWSVVIRFGLGALRGGAEGATSETGVPAKHGSEAQNGAAPDVRPA